MDTIELLAEISVLKERLKNSVEVVRCGDCEYWKQIDLHFGECLRLPGEMVIAENWFCADGELKEPS